MQVKYILSSFLFLVCCHAYAQQPGYNKRPEFLKANSVWAFGNYGGLNFNNGTPSPTHTEMVSESGCASVADPVTGNLLFYSNGDKVWNANHQLMPDGQDLLNNPVSQSLQCVCIVPVINTPGQYYIFSLNGLNSQGSPLTDGTLFYSIVDMSLNNGLGNVVTTKKKVRLSSDTISSAMIAIPGNNCGNIWLMVHSYSTSRFMAYHITKDGIDATPVVSDDLINMSRNNALLAVSPDRRKIAITNADIPNGTLVGQFDAATGQVSDVIRFSGSKGQFTGVCFSPDNTKLYLASLGRGTSIFQYDLSTFTAADITLSEQSIVAGRSGEFYSLKLYNDTVYTYQYTSPIFGGLRSISRINQPNLSGSACDYQADVLQLMDDTISLGRSFPNEVVLSLPPDTTFTLTLDSVVCKADFTLSAPSGFDTYQWNDGTSTANRTITAPGTYWVASNDICSPRVDTFIIAGVGFSAPVITANVHELTTTPTYNTYQWLLDGATITGATTNSHTALKNGNYQVIVTSADGCTDTSSVKAITDITATAITSLSISAAQVSVYPNPATTVLYISAPAAVDIALSSIDGRIVKQLQQINTVDIQDLSTGIYLLQITDKNGKFIKTEKLVKQ